MTFREEIKISAAIGSKDYDTAIAGYDKILEVNESDYQALSMLALIYEWKGDSEKSIHYANKLLAQDPSNFELLLLSARYWFDRNDEDQAYNYACRAIENLPKSLPDIPRWVFLLLKPLSIFKKFRGLQAYHNDGKLKQAKRHKDSIDWAWKYKEYYEAKHRQNK